MRRRIGSILLAICMMAGVRTWAEGHIEVEE